MPSLSLVFSRKFSIDGRLSVLVQKSFPGYRYQVLVNMVHEYEGFPARYFFKELDGLKFYKSPDDLLHKLISQLKKDQEPLTIFTKRQIWSFLALFLYRNPSQANLIQENETVFLKLEIENESKKGQMLFALWSVFFSEPIRELFMKVHPNVLVGARALDPNEEIILKSSFSQLNTLVHESTKNAQEEKETVQLFQPDHEVAIQALGFPDYVKIFKILNQGNRPFFLFPRIGDAYGDLVFLDTQEVVEFIPEQAGKAKCLTHKLNKIQYFTQKGFKVTPMLIDSLKMESFQQLLKG